MDFRTLINKLDSFNTEAKKEPERLTFVTALQHVKDITFSPPTKRSSEFSIANNIAFKGQDVNDPKVKLPLVQNALKVSPAMLFGEIAQRIKPTTDAQISLSDLLGNISNKMDPDGSHIGMLTKEEKNFAVEVVKAALRGMSLERDPDQSTYKDSDEPDASEMESTNEDTNKDLLGDLKSGLENAKAGDNMSDFIADEIGDYIRSGIEDMGEEAWQDSIEGKALAELDPVDTPEEQAKAFQNAINILKGGNESTNESDFDRSSVTYDEVLPFVKMTYKTLLTDLQTARQDIENYKAGGDDGEEGGDIAMIMPYLRDLKDMQKYVKAILDNPDMDIETVVDHMMPAGLDTSASEDLVGRFKKSFAKDPQLAKRLFKDPQLDFYSEDVEATEWFKGQTDVSFNGDEFYEAFGWIEENDENVVEAEYQGRTVKLNKPMRGDVKKFKVYVKNPKGNVVKVNFGDPDMRIKKSNPARRRSFRARHNCDNPGPKTKARYWSCRKW